MAGIKCARSSFGAVERSILPQTSHRILPSATLARKAASRSLRHGTSILRQPTQRPFSSFPVLRKEEPPHSSGIAPPKSYSYEEVLDLTTHPSSDRILIDVREPSELLATGRIPTAKSIPISSAPDSFFMSEEDFEMKFGFPRPSEKDEVIFYCKAGVRSRQAALLAGQARPLFGGKVGNYQGSWVDWEKNGGKAEREGEQGEESSVSGVTNPGGVPGTPRG